MNLRLTFATVAAACLAAGAALAADHEAGVPLSPGEAAGAWTVESHGHAVCMIQLSPRKAGAAGFAAAPRGDCGALLPAGVAGWTPASGGMALTASNGQVLLPFDRWSNSLFVARIASGDEVQLMRGGPRVRPDAP